MYSMIDVYVCIYTRGCMRVCIYVREGVCTAGCVCLLVIVSIDV